MKTIENVKLLTVGNLLDSLSDISEDNWHYDVKYILPDEDETACIMSGCYTDKDGDLCILIDENWDGESSDFAVEALKDELESYDPDTKVYLVGGSVCFTFDAGAGYDVFAEDEDCEEVTCFIKVIGKYENFESEEDPDHDTEQEGTEAAEPSAVQEQAPEEKHADAGTVVARVCLAVLLIGIIAYNVFAIITSKAGSLFGKIAGIVLCGALLVWFIIDMLPRKSGK